MIRQDIRLENFSGKLTFYSELAHPLDTFSIIAYDTVGCYLYKGMYVDESGKPVTDPRLLDVDFRHYTGTSFVLEDIFNKMICNNENSATCCVPIHYEIKQGTTLLYQARIPSLCIPTGEHTVGALTPAIEVSVNTYDQRLPDEDLKIAYSIGDLQKGSSTIEPQRHSPPSNDYVTYRNEPLGLDFEYMTGAQFSSVPDANNMLVVMNEAGKVEEMALLDNAALLSKENNMGINDPFFFHLRRDDVNGSISVNIIDAKQFDKQQAIDLLAFMNQIESTDIRCFTHEGIEVCVPIWLHLLREKAMMPLVYDGFIWMIRDGERLIFMDVYSVVPDETKNKIALPGHEIDREKTLNSIRYHGVQLAFSWNDSGKLEHLAFYGSPRLDAEGRKLQHERYQSYHHFLQQYGSVYTDIWEGKHRFNQPFLDRLIKNEGSTYIPVLPRFNLLTPDNDTIRHYRQFIWEEQQLAFSHRISDGDAAMPVFSNAAIAYLLDENGEITTAQRMADGAPDSIENGLVIKGKMVEIQALTNEKITVTTIPLHTLKKKDAHKIVAFENQNDLFTNTEIMEYPVGDFTFIISKDLINP
ncbi:MAG: hypothetical protein R2795_20720 [Saprospiraceae bacterium]